MAQAKKTKAQEALADERSNMTQQIVPNKKSDDQNVIKRPTALDFKKAQKLKELILQDVVKGRTQSYTQYTKSLVKQYLQNPTSYRLQLVGVSRFLWRVSILYKKIILYYATMPLYNYNVIQKMEFTKTPNVNKITKDYEGILRHLNKFNFRNEFATAIALAIRDGVFCGYVYDNQDDGMFLHMLPVEYYRIRGKNEAGQWIVAFDATYFESGQNKIFVEGINGDTSGCWAQEFIDGYNEYLKDKQNRRWFFLDPSKTITLIAGMQDDEFDNPLPFMTGIFNDLLDIIDYSQLLADKEELENYKLLLFGIPLIDGDTVDDFKVSLEIAEAYKAAVQDISPALVGTGLLPGLSLETVSFESNSTANTTDIVTSSIKNLYKSVGVSEVVVSSGDANSAMGIKNSIANDSAYAFLLIKRLESNFQYYIDENISENYIFSILRQTWYNEEQFIEATRQAATLGSSAMVFLESQGYTPYEAYCQILFENAIGIKDIMIPLLSSYNTAWGDTKATKKAAAGRNRVSDDEISDSAERTRNITDDNV